MTFVAVSSCLFHCVRYHDTGRGSQTLTFAVMPSDDGGGAAEAADFFDYVTTTFPETAHHWASYDSESEFMDIVTDKDYSQDPTDDRPAFSAGIVFTSGSPAWAYTVREDRDGLIGGRGAINCEAVAICVRA